MKLSTLSLMSTLVLASFLVAGCATPTTQNPTADAPAEEVVPTEPTPTAPSEQPTGDVAAAPVEVASTKQANTETSLLNWRSKKVWGEHWGTVKLSNGSLDFDANNKLVGGTFTIDMTTITVDDTDNEGLLNHIKSDDFFSVETNPTSTFTITSTKELSPTTYEVAGNLTIKWITNPVTFVATVDESMTFTAPITIDRTLWDIKFRSLKFFSDVADKAIEDTITFDVVLTTVQ